jgi:hypothetical protein
MPPKYQVVEVLGNMNSLDLLVSSIIDGTRKIAKLFYGKFWYRPVRDSFYDCLGVSSILFLNSIFQKISGKDFSGINSCRTEFQAFSDRPDFLACGGIVALGFATWLVLSIRIINRIWEDLATPVTKKLTAFHGKTSVPPVKESEKATK